MRRNDLNAIITGIVHRYIKEGWVLEMDSSSYGGVDGVYFFSRGRKRAAVGIRRPEFKEVLKEVAKDDHFANSRGLNSRILFECHAAKGSFDWVEPGNVINERVFFKVDNDWYVDDVREAGMTVGRRRERWMTRDRAYSLLSFHPTEASLDRHIRQRRDWKTVRPADIIIEKRGGVYWIRRDFGNRDFFAALFPPECQSGCRKGTGGLVAPP